MASSLGVPHMLCVALYWHLSHLRSLQIENALSVSWVLRHITFFQLCHWYIRWRDFPGLLPPFLHTVSDLKLEV